MTVRAYRVFRIEAMLGVNPARPGWSPVRHDAFTDGRFPGAHNLFNSIGHNCDVTQHRTRITRRTHPDLTEFADEFAFTDRDAAIACCARLSEHGRWRSAWEGEEIWRKRERASRPVVRVVEINLVETRVVVAVGGQVLEAIQAA